MDYLTSRSFCLAAGGLPLRRKKKVLSLPLYDNMYQFSSQRYMCQTYTPNERNIFLLSAYFLCCKSFQNVRNISLSLFAPVQKE
ncbi:hypothetical protein X975_14190, partial [Stegodyphus mimosarum]